MGRLEDIEPLARRIRERHLDRKGNKYRQIWRPTSVKQKQQNFHNSCTPLSGRWDWGGDRLIPLFLHPLCKIYVEPPKSRGHSILFPFGPFHWQTFGSFGDTHFTRRFLLVVDEVETCTNILYPLWRWNGGKRTTTHLR